MIPNELALSEEMKSAVTPLIYCRFQKRTFFSKLKTIFNRPHYLQQAKRGNK